VIDVVARASESDTNVNDVIATLTGVGEADGRTPLPLLVERAQSNFDVASAESASEKLVAHLTESPTDARGIEALIVLGLAHPEALTKHRISMAQEGRRLAVLLEKQGEAERAQTLLEVLSARHPGDRAIDHELSGVMRRNGNLDRLVERHISRAEEALRSGNRDEAIRWLREVLSLDNSRRDVARMIRDLRFEQSQRGVVWRKGTKSVAISLLAIAAVTGVVWREQDIRRQYGELPSAQGDVASVRRRLQAVDELVEKNLLWVGMFDASEERVRLRTEIERLEAERISQERKVAEERMRALTLAESERSQARTFAERYQFEQALIHLQAAIAAAPQEWEHRKEVERDIQAIEEWRKNQRPQGAR
jgi:tetratricopeptide (TPR) repeat protein